MRPYGLAPALKAGVSAIPPRPRRNLAEKGRIELPTPFQVSRFSRPLGVPVPTSPNLAVRRGFEPRIPFGMHAFQACALNHSAISPDAGNKRQSIGASKPQPFGSLSRSISVQHRCESYFKIGGERESRTPKTLSSLLFSRQVDLPMCKPHRFLRKPFFQRHSLVAALCASVQSLQRQPVT
jgi:hypothetical protein